MFRKDPIKAIIEALKLNPEGLTLLSLAQVTGLHRHTCRKYIDELVGTDVVFQRDVGAAKLCYLNKKIENKEQENILIEGLKKKRRSKYQLRLLVAVVLVTFLLSETVIIATQNISLFNETNFSEINTSPVTSTTNISDLGAFFNISTDVNGTENVTVEPPTNETFNLTVGIVENTNGSSNSQNTSENSTLNLTNLTENDTISNETAEQNTTVNETNTTNETSIDLPPIETPVIEPKFSMIIDYPRKIIRGEEISLEAVVTSDSFAKNVHLKWVLPQGMEIVSGNEIETCGVLNTTSCVSVIGVRTEMSVIGSEMIKVVVSYEK